MRNIARRINRQGDSYIPPKTVCIHVICKSHPLILDIQINILKLSYTEQHKSACIINVKNTVMSKKQNENVSFTLSFTEQEKTVHNQILIS